MNRELIERTEYSHKLLTNYIGIHNNIFNSPSGFFGKLKKILKPMNFEEYVSKLDFLVSELKKNDNEVEILSDLDEQDSKLQTALTLFNNSLLDTLNYLRILCIGLDKKSKNQSYPISEYQSDHKTYQQSVEVYQVNGTILNNTYQTI